MRVNGAEMILDKPLSVAAFLDKEGYDQNRVAVEKNGTVISRKSYSEEMLSEDDRLEIVSFIGGG